MSDSTPHGPRSEKEIFFDALDQPTAQERTAFLDRACGGDPMKRARVNALLASHFQPDAFMEEPAVGRPRSRATSSDPSAPPPSMPVRYKLLEKIGEGGFGEVWLAEQREPVKRQVALKILKLGMDSRQVVARFEAERQALAMMDHPNIAKIYDAGTTGLEAGVEGRDGGWTASRGPQPGPRLLAPDSQVPPPATRRPYFVMELVRGVQITDYCDQHQLTTRQRLELFITTCHAIQHAHQKGVIHRDIKPSNILVTLHDGMPVPKVIDFGIAKAAQGELTDKTLLTQFTQFLGTPAYISPEQAEMGGLDIDTRSDIYSLGVLLYELLVGRTPFDPAEMTKGGLDALRHIIRHKDPIRPSTRVKTLSGLDQSAASERRRTEPMKLCHQLRGDLDWIVLKCLDKDRTRRYQTANGLARDLQRHLANEPVVASPPSVLYTLRKTWQRHWLATVAGTVAMLGLVTGTAVSTWQSLQARQARDVAEAARNAEAAQRRAAQTALRHESSARMRAEASEQVAQRLLYVANLNLIRQAWEANNLGRIQQLLDESAGAPQRGFEWYYWQRQTHLDLKTLRGHTARVWSANFSPDGSRIVTASDDGTAKVWESLTGRELLTLPAHADWVRSAAFSPDGRRIVTGSKDYIARVWDAASGQETLRLRGHRAPIRTVEFLPDGRRIVTASQDGSARIWDAESGRPLLVLRGHSNWVFSAASSPDGRRIVTGGDDDTARIWDAADGRELLRLTGHEGNVRTAAFSPDSRLVVTASQDRTARVWDAETGELRLTLHGHHANVFSASFAPDGRRILTTSRDQTIRLWEVEGGHELYQLKGHSSEIYSGVFSKDGRQILTASEDATAKVWDAASPPAPLALEHGGAVLAVAISPDSQRIATGGSVDPIRIWSISNGERQLTLPSPDGEVRALAFSPDGGRLATGHGDGNTRVWLAATGHLLLAFSSHRGGVNSVAFSPDGGLILTSGGEGKTKVWSAQDGREHLSLPHRPGQGFCARFSPQGSRIVTGSSWGARIHDAHTGAETLRLLDAPSMVRSVLFSPDGRWVFTASEDRTARTWNATTGEPRCTLAGHTFGVSAAAYSPDGERIVTCSGDPSAKVWDANTGQELLTLGGHKDLVTSAAFTPDGRCVVTGSLDGTALVWAVALPEQVSAWQQERLGVSNRLQAATARPPPKMAVHSPRTSLPPGLITRWLVLAPVKTPGLDAASALDLEQIPGEATLQPRAQEREQFPGSDRGLTWEASEQTVDLLDLNVILGQASSSDSVAYAICYLVTEAPQLGVVLHVTGDDAFKIYLNGEAVHRSDPDRAYILDEEKVGGLQLAAGVNTLVFKLWNHTERWLGSVRVLGATGRPIPGLRVTLDPGAAP